MDSINHPPPGKLGCAAGEPEAGALRTIRIQLFAALALFFVLLLLCRHVHSSNLRVAYAVSRMPLAAMLMLGFAILVEASIQARVWRWLQARSDIPCLVVISLLFAAFWLPVTVLSGFAADDWPLLAAAAQRTILINHPWVGWLTLDTVDANFRPLTTGWIYAAFVHFFGVRPGPFLALNFCVNLAATLLLFAIARTLGLSRTTAFLAASLFLSRGMLYTLIGWPCAISDGVVVAAEAAVVWLIFLGQSNGRRIVLIHCAAWLIYCCALFAKQSAYTIVPIVFLTILLGARVIDGQSRLRWKAAFISLAAYSPPAMVVFLHARTLAAGTTPYPVELKLSGFTHLFAYLSFYLFMLDVPGKYRHLADLPWIAGLLVAVGVIAALRFTRAKLIAASEPLLIYTILCAAASISLFALLPTRSAGYYGVGAAFWVSIALAAVLTRCAQKGSVTIVTGIACALVLTGFINVRLSQTGLIPSGGYIWGTFNSWLDLHVDAAIQRRLDSPRAAGTAPVVFVVQDPSAFTNEAGAINDVGAMALLHSHPQVGRILFYDVRNQIWYSNDRNGFRPDTGVSDYRDAGQYHWSEPLSGKLVVDLKQDPDTRWIAADSWWIDPTHSTLSPAPVP